MKQNIRELRERISSDIHTFFPAVYNFDRASAAQILGVVPGHLCNLEKAGKPLVVPVRIGTKPVYPLNRLVDCLVEQQLAWEGKRRRGAPTKAERLRRQADQNNSTSY
jgi:hypothetical protein